MSKAVKILLALAALLAIVVVGVVAYVATIDFDRYKPLLAAQVKAATGRDLEIKGRIAPRIGLTPALTVEGVTLANAPWGAKRPMVSVERFEAQLQLVPLLTSFGRTVIVDRVLLRGADIWLETDDKGVGNWKFDVAPVPPARAAAQPASAGGSGPDIVVRNVDLQNVTLAFKPGPASPTVLAVETASMRGESATSPLRIAGKGAYNKLPFELGGQIGSIDALMKGPLPLDLTLRSGDRAALKVAGSVRDPLATRDYDLTITAEMPEIGRAGALAAEAGVPDVAIPALGPLRLEIKVQDRAPNGRPSWSSLKIELGGAETMRVAIAGAIRDPLGPMQTPVAAPGVALRIEGTASDLANLARKLGTQAPLSGPLRIAGEIADQGADRVALKGFEVAAAGSDLAADAVLGFGGAKPSLSGRVRSKTLDLTRLVPPPADAGAAPAPSTRPPQPAGRLLPDTKLPFDTLAKADADLEVSIDAIRTPDMTIENLRARLGLRDGTLTLKPVSFDMDGGKFTLETALAARDMTLVQKIQGRGIEVGRILQERRLNDWFRGGRTSLDVSLAGKGATMQAIAASLDGSVALEMGPGEIGQAAQRVIGQWLSAISPTLGQIQLGTSVRCAVYSIGFVDGIGTLRSGVFETALLTARTSGSVNLRNETLALRTQVGPIGVRTAGSLSSPQTGIDAAGTVQGVIEGAAGAAVGVATGGVVGGVLGAVTGGSGGGSTACGGSGGAGGSGAGQQPRPAIPTPGGGGVPLPNLPNPFRR
jgi:uncharacterized protein involved in outer membrane biogenesis